MGLDLGKFLRDRKDQAVRQWQDSVVLDAVSSGTKADNDRRANQGTAETVRQRASQSYGNGFSGVMNRARDVVDADTPADWIKRQANSGLFETYQEQQNRLTNEAVNSQTDRTLLAQFGASGLREMGKFFLKAPGSIANMYGAVAQSENPIAEVAKGIIPGLGVYSDADKRMGHAASQDLQRQANDLNKQIDQKINQNDYIGERQGENKWAVGLGSVAGQLPAQIATGYAGLVNTGVQMASDEYNKAREAGRSNDQALGIGTLQGAASAASEKFGIDKFLPGNGVAGNSVIKVLKRFGTEGGQEAQQRFTQNLIANKTYDPNQGLKDGVFESAIFGGIAGSAMSPIADLANIGTTPNTPAPLTPEVQNKRNNLANAYTTLVDQGRPDQAAYFAREIDQIDNPAPGTLRERIRSAKERIITPLDGVGSVPIGSPLIPIPKKLQNKLSGTDPLESLKQEAIYTNFNGKKGTVVGEKDGYILVKPEFGTGTELYTREQFDRIMSKQTEFVADAKKTEVRQSEAVKQEQAEQREAETVKQRREALLDYSGTNPMQRGRIDKMLSKKVSVWGQEGTLDEVIAAHKPTNKYRVGNEYVIDASDGVNSGIMVLPKTVWDRLKVPEMNRNAFGEKTLVKRAGTQTPPTTRENAILPRVGDTPLPIKQDVVIGDTTPLKRGNTRPDPLTTVSGRKIQLDQYNPSAKSSAADSRTNTKWNQTLIKAAIEEAKLRNDSMNLGIFEDMQGTSYKNLSESDMSGIHQYLFDSPDPIKLTYNQATQSQPPKSPPVQKVETPVESKTNVDTEPDYKPEYYSDKEMQQMAIDHQKWVETETILQKNFDKSDTELSKLTGMSKKEVADYKSEVADATKSINEMHAMFEKNALEEDTVAKKKIPDVVKRINEIRKTDTSKMSKRALDKLRNDANSLQGELMRTMDGLNGTDKQVKFNGETYYVKGEVKIGKDTFSYLDGEGEYDRTFIKSSDLESVSQPKKPTPFQKDLQAVGLAPKNTKPKKPFTPISQPVDNLPAVVKQVTKKQTSEQKIAPPVVAPAVQKQTPAPRPIKTTKPKSPERLVVGGKSAEVSSDGRIANIDEFVKQQVAEQEAEPEKTGRISKLKRVWIDTLSPAEDNFRQAVKDGKLSQETLDDIIVKNGKSIRSGTAANINLVESGLVDLLHNKSKEDYDNLGQTLIAIHAKDLRANGIETGRDAALDEQIVAKYGEQFKADIEQFRDAANYVLDKSVASQLISKETADMLKKKYPNYVPMNRVMEELENTGSFNSSQIASIGKQTVVRKIKGSKRTVENPLESMISKVQDMTKQSLKNEAAIAWVDALKKTGDAKLIEGTVKPGESTISVIRNGNKEIYSVEPEMEAAAKGLTKEQMGTITNAARKVSRVFKTGTTGLNLPFIVTNLARDQQNALLNQSKGELETFKAIPTAIMETLGHGKLYQEAVRNGAISTSFDLTKPNLKLTAANIRKRGSSLGALSKIEDVIGRSEEYTRIQQYKATKEYWLEQGMSESQAQNKATIAAQQNSADFARAGDLGQILNAWLPYTNAGVQGTRSTLRAAKNNPVRYATKAGAMLVMPTIMTALWNTGDEERKKIYDDISENDKQASFIVITPWAKKNEEGKWEGIVKIPKPPGISALLYPVEKGVASMNGLDPVGFKDIVKGVLGFGSPLGDNLNAAVSTVTPQAIKPAVEATINRNLFTNRDIVPYWLKDKPANEQAYKGSSGTARMISSLTGVSPIKVEHMIRGYGGELGLQGLNAADNALNKAGLIPKEQIGGISIPAGFKKRFTEAYDKPGSTIQRGTGAGASATAAKNYEDAVAGIKSSYGGKYAELTEEEVKELGKTDADAKDYYKTLQAVKQSSKTPDELPTNLNPLATSIYEKEARLTTDGKDKWNKRPSANKEVNNTIKSWLPKGVDAPRITNETTKKWADYEKKKADGTLGKLEEESAKRTILRSAYNSVLTEDEKDLYTLSKDKLLDAYDRGVINDQNIDKALKVERQLFDAGLISTETLAKKLGLVARGYKGRSGGRGGRGGSSKIAKDTSVAFSNALQSTTLKRLNSLLAGTQSGGSTSRRVATSKPVLKKITVRT